MRAPKTASAFTALTAAAALAGGAVLLAPSADAAAGTPAQRALRWIIDQPGVTTTIPGASSPDQALANAAAASLAPTTPEAEAAYADIYDRYAREHVHHRW